MLSFLNAQPRNSEKVAYVCSPCRADTRPAIIRNMLAARKYCEITTFAMSVKAIAPHAWLPEILDDHDPDQRAMAINFGIDLLKMCHLLLVCGNRLTQGMINEIKLAAALEIPVMVFSDDIAKDVLTLTSGKATVFPGRLVESGIGSLAVACEDIGKTCSILSKRTGSVMKADVKRKEVEEECSRELNLV